MQPDETTAGRRRPLRDRGLMRYDTETIHGVLDETFACYVGYLADGLALVVPLTHVRIGNFLYLHGSTGSRLMLAARSEAIQLSVAVTVLDALVFARAQFMHTLNYRSVVVHGRAHRVTDAAQKMTVMASLVDRLAPGRAADSRPPSPGELAQTAVLALSLDDAAARVQSGEVQDEPADMTLPHWAGVVPVRLAAGPIRSDTSAATAPLPVPAYLRHYQQEQEAAR